jgi:hypothetical protein
MAMDLETVLSGNVMLKRFNLLILEFNDRAALCADQMIMMRIRLRVLIAGKTILKPPFLG